MPETYRYRMYVDESGDHTYSKLNEEGHRFLCLVGVWFRHPDKYAEFQDGLDRLKRDTFGPRLDEQRLVFHRSDMRNKRGPYKVLADQAVADKFNASLLELVSASSFTVVGVVIDKLEHKIKYVTPNHPYHYCMELLLERYCGWLRYYNRVGDVLAEARGGVEDRLLSDAYYNFYKSGTRYLSIEQAQAKLTTKKLKLKTKEHDIAGLQLADILAHPIRRSIAHATKGVGVPPGGFGGELFDAIKEKFNRNQATGAVTGYGQIIIPK